LFREEIALAAWGLLGIVLDFCRSEAGGAYRSATFVGTVSHKRLRAFVRALEHFLEVADRFDRTQSKDEIWDTARQLRQNQLFGYIGERLVEDLKQGQRALREARETFIAWPVPFQFGRESSNIMEKLEALGA
jgi:hypothetical protein